MKKALFLIAFGFIFQTVFAQDAEFPIVQWTSQNSSDVVTINNGNNAALMVNINVASNQSGDDGVGINVRNCGSTTHVAAGSSVVCYTNNSTTPVNFNSDDASNSVSGTYQIQPQPTN